NKDQREYHQCPFCWGTKFGAKTSIKILFHVICSIFLGGSMQLNNPLVEHGVSDFHEAGDVRPDDKITRLSVFGGCFPRVLKYRGHDVTQTRINFLARPWQTHRVLAHLKPGCRHTAGVCRFARTEENFFLQEKIDSCWDT